MHLRRGEATAHIRIKDEGDLRFAQMLCRYVPLTLTVDQGTVTREPMRELAEAIAAFAQETYGVHAE